QLHRGKRTPGRCTSSRRMPRGAGLMSKQQRHAYVGCSVEANGRGGLRLRFRIVEEEVEQHPARTIPKLKDTPENRRRARTLAEVVGRLLEAGKDPRPYLDELFAATPSRGEESTVKTTTSLTGPTVESYGENFIRGRQPIVRKAQARDDRRHL